MKRFILFLIPCLLLQSFAWAAPSQDLRQLIDEYRYSLTVEWNQKDEAALAAINSRFSDQLKALDGLSQSELREALRGQKDVDPVVLELLKDKDGKVVLQKLQDLIKERSHEMYAEGSSWAPSAGSVFGVGLGILFFAEIAVLVIYSKDDVCPNAGAENAPEGVQYDCQYP
ncbi:MAG: hypothetical protein ACJ76H_11635 [Bacteriovoracaceae bacterium]